MILYNLKKNVNDNDNDGRILFFRFSVTANIFVLQQAYDNNLMFGEAVLSPLELASFYFSYLQQYSTLNILHNRHDTGKPT